MRAPIDDRPFDLIIAGAGLAGLSLVTRLVRSGWTKGKRILLVDKDAKRNNDRTWCYWENGDGFFESIVLARWQRMWFRSNHASRLLDLAPYTYKLIRGIDLYEHCFRSIQNEPGMAFVNARIDRIFSNAEDGTGIVAGGTTYNGRYVFNSIPDPISDTGAIHLLQHFKGWWVRTTKDHFDPGEATLMDLRTPQQDGATFFYVLPIAPNEALIEYTLFSERSLRPEDYDRALRDHVRNKLQIHDYRILQEEVGVIPMTNVKFPMGKGSIINIGTAGGCTKPSTGYTFQFVQEQTRKIAELLVNGDDPRKGAEVHSARFRFYDSIFLDVLQKQPTGADRIFSHLFNRNPPGRILRFLNNRSTLPEELSIIASLPTMPFLQAAVRQGSK